MNSFDIPMSFDSALSLDSTVASFTGPTFVNQPLTGSPFGPVLGMPAPRCSVREMLRRVSAYELALDLGTANSLVYVHGAGIVLNEPSLVAVSDTTGEPVAFGRKARDMAGRTGDHVRVVRPLRDGVVGDFRLATLMVKHFFRQVIKRLRWCRPRVVVGIPAGVTQIEKRGILDLVLEAGAGAVHAVEEPTAAALGAGLPIDRPLGTMIVDIGGGTTEVAILSLGGSLCSRSLRVAGDEMDRAICRHLVRNFGIEVSQFEAERIKLLVGSARPFARPRTLMITGRDVATGFPINRELSDTDIRASFEDIIRSLVNSVVTVLEQMSPQVAEDISEEGIYLSGGGSLLKGLPERLSDETGLCFRLTADPLSSVVRGAGAVVDDFQRYRSLCVA